MCKCVKKRVIVDGELVVLTDGKPNFYALQKRSLMGNKFRISLAAKKNPVQFVAYDILYFDGKDLTDKPLMERKAALSKAVTEGHNLSVSRWIEKNGVAFFELAKKENLEDIVAKKKDGLYHIGKRTSEWIKIKVMQDEDLLVLGYQPDDDGKVKDLILGYYDESGVLQCRGKVYNGEANTTQSACLIFGIISLKASFCTQGLSYLQALQPKQPFTVFLFKLKISISLPLSITPFEKAFTSWNVFPFGLPPPITNNIFFIY